MVSCGVARGPRLAARQCLDGPVWSIQANRVSGADRELACAQTVGHQSERLDERRQCEDGERGVSWRMRRCTRRSRSFTWSWMSTACWKRVTGSVYETPVVPVTTGATLGVDTSCVSFGRKPEERHPAANRVGKRQRAQAPGLIHPMTRALLVRSALQGCRFALNSGRGWRRCAAGGARGIKAAPNSCGTATA